MSDKNFNLITQLSLNDDAFKASIARVKQNVKDLINGVEGATGNIGEMGKALAALKNISFAGKSAEEIKQINDRILALNQAMTKLRIEQGSATAELTTNVTGGFKQMVTQSEVFKKSMGGILASVVPLGGLSGAVMNGVSAFKVMVPAINGVKIALISSGVGAIVVALGLALAGLTAYLNGTSEGANKLKIAFAYVSGIVETIMVRLKFLGAAIVSIFTADWDAMKQNFKEAFASGFFDQAKKSAEESVDRQKEEIAIGKAKRELIVQEASIKRELAVLNSKARDMDENTKEGAKAKLEYVQKEFQLSGSLLQAKMKIAEMEINSQQTLIKIKGGADKVNGDEKTKLQELIAAKINLETEYIDFKTSQQRLIGKLQKEINAEDKAGVEEGIKNKENLDKLNEISKNIELDNAKVVSRTKEELALAEVEKWKEAEMQKVDAVKILSGEQINLLKGEAKEQAIVDKQEQIALAAKVKAQIIASSEIRKAKAQEVYKANESDKEIEVQKQLQHQQDRLNKIYYDTGRMSFTSYQNDRLEAFKKSQDDEVNLLENKIKRENLLEIDAAKLRKDLDKKQHNDEKLFAEEQKKIAEDTKKANLGTLADQFGQAAGLFQQNTEAYKVMATAQAGIATYLSAVEAFEAGTKIGGPILGAVFSAMAVVAGLENIAKINSYAYGGIVPGSNYSGDKVPIMANSGEMILNGNQQSNLFSILNNGGGIASLGKEVVFRIEGTELIGVLNNYNRKIKSIR